MTSRETYFNGSSSSFPHSSHFLLTYFSLFHLSTSKNFASIFQFFIKLQGEMRPNYQSGTNVEWFQKATSGHLPPSKMG